MNPTMAKMRDTLLVTAFAGAMLATGAWAKETPPAAKEANARGMALYHKKDYKGAADQFRRAIEAYNGYVQAHYNLVCVASLLRDMDTALTEASWLSNRATFDPAAKEKLEKAANDHDLDAAREDQEIEGLLSGPMGTDDLLRSDMGIAVGKPVAGPDRAAAQQALSKLPGRYESRCDPNDSAQGVIYEMKAELPLEAPPTKMTIRASLADGVAIFDAKGGALAARSAPIGCRTANASRETLSLLKVMSTGAGGYLYIVRYRSGVDAKWTDEVMVFRRRGKELVSTFNVAVASSADPRPVKLEQTFSGDIMVSQPGIPSSHVYRWDKGKFQYVQYWPETAE